MLKVIQALNRTVSQLCACGCDAIYPLTILCHLRNMHMGVCTITCYLHACRHQNESKSRKYLAKVLWLLTCDDDKSTLAEAVDKYCVGVPAIQWLPWYVHNIAYVVCFRKLDVLDL